MMSVGNIAKWFCSRSSLTKLRIMKDNTRQSLLPLGPLKIFSGHLLVVEPVSCTLLLSRNSVTFWERDRKAGYGSIDRPSNLQRIKQGAKLIGPELKQLQQEWIDKFTFDNFDIVTHGSYKLISQLNTQEAIGQYVVTSDSDHNEGKSKASFSLGEHNYGVFSGYINTEIPKDGIIKRSGYCSIRGPTARKSLKRKATYDYFADYTHVVIRYRGDGRPYLVNLKVQYDLDLLWQDTYSYPLFTRGGPYWQVAKIPFSKFFLGFKGRIQDKQEKIPLEKVEHWGITCSDQNTGPFFLELDYIGLIHDHSHEEKFAYEMYEVPPGVANV